MTYLWPDLRILKAIAFAAISIICQSSVVTAAEFPLQISRNGRYLVDRQEQPFLVVGDTAWSLIVQPDADDALRYLDDRRDRGFNAIIVNLIEHKYCSTPPRTRQGLAPFLQPEDVATWNPEYFDAAWRVVQAARERGMVVWLWPAYFGRGGGDEGFFRELKASGPERVRSYARFVGRRFRDLPNIVWVLGGDDTPPAGYEWVVLEVARGIRDEDPDRLMTYHAARNVSAATAFGNETWLSVNNVYPSAKTPFRDYLAEFNRRPIRPIVSIEAIYEDENNATPELIRRLAYWPMLAGGCGQFFGNNPIWCFDGPGIFPKKVTWQQALDGTGSRDMTRFRDFFAKLPWYELVPDEKHAVVTDGFGEGRAEAVTACTADKRLSITYIPATGTEGRELTVNLAWFAAPVLGRWHNPADGRTMPINTVPLPSLHTHKFVTPQALDAGARDWLLVLQSP